MSDDECTCPCDCQTCEANRARGGYEPINPTCPIHGEYS